MNKTKIGLPSNSEDLSSLLANTFERCFYFVIVESDRQEVIITFLNCAQSAARGAGIQTAQSLVDQQVEIVITMRIGSDALGVLQDEGIRIYMGIVGTLQENIEAFRQGRLVEIKMAAGSHITSKLLVDCDY